MFDAGVRIGFEPLAPLTLLGVLAVLAALTVLYALLRRARGGLLRLLLMTALLLFLSGPTLVQEERRYHDDVAIVVVDRSLSQQTGEREAQTDRALKALNAGVENFADLDVRIVEAGGEGAGVVDGSMLLTAARRALEDVPRERLAGVVFITDGLAHDLPEDGDSDLFGAPVHVLLSGVAVERDRRIEIVSAPAFGIVRQQVQAVIIVHDNAAADGAAIRVTLRQDGRDVAVVTAPPNQQMTIPLTLGHGGRNLFEFVAEPAPVELTLANNSAALTINGVRDRLRVLLVSGQPYSGERSWRNLLKADPAVDLVHITILRPPRKQDMTPINELALIPFPVQELFELKIKEFDLIIFDRYWRRGLLNFTYLNNIADHVMKGGALLDSAGPSFAGPASLYRTALSKILPGRPTGAVTVRGFRPQVSARGARHPVTAALPKGSGGKPWGRWFRQIDIDAADADVLLTGADSKPLLVLDSVGEGRVAQLLSDQAWLWARGFEGGGPQAEIFRRTAHWLMREPALEHESLSIEASGRQLLIERQSLDAGPRSVRLTGPDGVTKTVPLQEGRHGRSFARVEVADAGLYRAEEGELTSVAVLGNLNPLEFSELVSTPARFAGHVAASGGALIRLENMAEPVVRRVGPDGRRGGRGWFGLVENRAYDVTSLSRTPLAPPLPAVLLLLLLAMATWRREGR